MTTNKQQDKIDGILAGRRVKSIGEDSAIDKLVFVNRTTKVVKGGRLMKFNALVISGDGNGMVGFGTGKASEVVDARKKATDEARRSALRVSLKEGRTIHHDVRGIAGAGKVLLRTAPQGTGIIAGGPMRAVFEALGIKDVVAKSLGSSNPFNMVRATFAALKAMESPKAVSARRGVKVNEILKRRQA